MEIEVGVMVGTFGEQATRENIERLATAADDGGFDAVWVGDHVTLPAEIPDTYPFSPSGEAPFDIGQDVYDCFGVLSYLAGVTDRVDLGTNTCIVPYRHPAVLARNAFTLEQLSGGRFDFGVAPGWLETEFEVLDVPFEERGSRTDEFLDLFERAREEPELAFDGPHHSLQRTGFHPAPPRGRPKVWVGGRSGVSQLVDRTDYMGVLSHLRRLRSPLSRSQPHFEARDLHATQWGRICPSETPEGPNCGLVKNFAQAMELSQNVDDERELKRELASMGVEGIPGIETVETHTADD